MAKNKKKIMHRRGPLSQDEQDKVAEWRMYNKDPKDIAYLLNRTQDQIEKYILATTPQKMVATVNKNERDTILDQLHSHSSWPSIKQQFSAEELRFFENDYCEYMAQFGQSTATELKQIHQMITLDIFMHRHNVERVQFQEDIKRLEKALKAEYNREPADQDREFIMHSQEQLNAYRAASSTRTKEYKDYLDKHQALLKDLKGTRDQRIKSIEDRGKFMSILKELELKETRGKIGEEIGLFSMAVEKEKNRLSQLYKYADGVVDQPILTCSNVILDVDEDNETAEQ